MTFYNIFLSFFIIYIIRSIDCVLNTEYIIGGYYAHEFTFQYQVAVQAKANFSDFRTTICGGGIIAEDFIVSAAHCFFDYSGDLDNKSFSVTAGTIDVLVPTGIDIDVDEIHIAGYEMNNILNDIAVLKLNQSFNFNQNWFIKPLTLPMEIENFSDTIAVVSGFGLNWVTIGNDPNIGREERLDGDSDQLLRYAFVKIVPDDICKNSYPHLVTTHQICGVMVPENPGEKWGICSGDSGSPLVIGNKLIGIVSSNPTDCDDTIKGCVYTKISSYLHFIQGSLMGSPRSYAQIYKNRPHIYA